MQQASRTALWTLRMRAAATRSHRSDVLDDPVAQTWLSAPWRALIAIPGMAELCELGFGAVGVGSVVLRAAWVDRRVAELADTGVRQVVLLGAGWDALAYRAPAGLRVIEIDHPATQAAKRARVGDTAAPEGVEHRYLPVDFERGELGDALRNGDIDLNAPTVVVWLGVTYYLTDDAAWSTLRELTGAFRGELHLMLDYLDVRALKRTFRWYHRGLARWLAWGGEPLLTSWKQERLAQGLLDVGLTVVADVGAAGLEAELGDRRLGAWRATPSVRVLHARGGVGPTE